MVQCVELLHYPVKQETCKLSFHLNAEMTKSVKEQWSLHRGVSVALLHSAFQEASTSGCFLV